MGTSTVIMIVMALMPVPLKQILEGTATADPVPRTISATVTLTVIQTWMERMLPYSSQTLAEAATTTPVQAVLLLIRCVTIHKVTLFIKTAEPPQ